MSVQVSLRVDERIELLYSVLIFTSWRKVGVWRGECFYKDDMLNFFKPYNDHSSVRFCEELIRSGFAFDAMHGFMMHLSVPGFEVSIPFPKDLTERVRDVGVLMEFAEALKTFYLDSDFMEFWSSHTGFYRVMEENSRRYIKPVEMVRILEDYFGAKKESYRIILLPLSRFSYGYCIDDLTAYAFIAPTGIGDDGVPEYRSLDPVIHELSHSFIDPLTEEFSGDFKNPENLLKPVRSKVKKVMGELLEPTGVDEKTVEKACEDWKYYVNEHLVEAVKLKIAEQLGFLDPSKLENMFSYYEERGFVYMRPVYNILSRYDRSKYESFRNFYPEIINALNRLA